MAATPLSRLLHMGKLSLGPAGYHLKMGTRSNDPGQGCTLGLVGFLGSGACRPIRLPLLQYSLPSCSQAFLLPLEHTNPRPAAGPPPCQLFPLLAHLPPTLSQHHSWGWFPIVLQTFS